MNDKKVDAELYAFLQSISQCENSVTYVNKWEMPKQTEICDTIGIKSTKTYRAHLNYLIEAGYVIEEESRYVLPRVEDFYLLLPLSTICFLKDVFKDQVVKAYLYLGQRWRNNGNADFEFTFEDLATHIGVKLAGNARGYEQIRNMLYVLSKCGLIEVSGEYFVERGKSRHRLLKWNDNFSE